MDLIGLPDGRPGEHLGVSHMLKHYLAPAEVWEDLAVQDDPARPWSILDVLAHLEPPAWRQWRDPGAELRGRWDAQLVPLYRSGYLGVVRRLAAGLTPVGSEPWRRCAQGRGRWVRGTPDGVVLIVAEEAGGVGLRTAFRPLGLTLKSHRSVPMNAENRELRSVVARQKARRNVILIAGGAQ